MISLSAYHQGNRYEWGGYTEIVFDGGLIRGIRRGASETIGHIDEGDFVNGSIRFTQFSIHVYSPEILG